MEAPSVEEASQKYGSQVKFVGVAWAGTIDSYEGFVAKHGLTFVNLNDSDGTVFSRFGVPGQPAWAFVEQDGTAQVELGTLSETELDDKVSAMISS